MIFKRFENIEHIFKRKTGAADVSETDSVYIVTSEAKKIIHKFSILIMNRNNPANVLIGSDLGIVHKIYKNLF